MYTFEHSSKMNYGVKMIKSIGWFVKIITIMLYSCERWKENCGKKMLIAHEKCMQFCRFSNCRGHALFMDNKKTVYPSAENLSSLFYSLQIVRWFMPH